MDSRFIKQLKKIKKSQISPDSVWVSENKEKLMGQVRNTTVPEKIRFSLNTVWQMVDVAVPGRLVYTVVRPALIFIFAGLVATSGWIAGASATADSLPGDLAYGVKMAVEKTQVIVVSLAGSEEEEARLHMEFASRRAEEVKKVAETEEEDTAEKAAVAIGHLQKSIESAGESLENMGSEDSENVVEVTKELSETTREIKKNLDIAEGQTSDVDVSDIKKRVKETSLKAVEDVVKKQAEGVEGISEEEVKDLVTVEIETVIEDAGVTKEEAEKVVQDLEDNKEATGETDFSVIFTSTSISVASSTLLTPSSTVVEMQELVDETNLQASETEEVVKVGLEEAKNLLEGGQLLEAMERVKEASGVAQEAEEAVVETKKVVDEAKKIVEVETGVENNEVDIVVEGVEQPVVEEVVVGESVL